MSYHDEQESIESVKAWWGRWGNLTTWSVLAVLVVAAGWNGWNYWLRSQTAQAARLYEQVQRAAESGDKAQVARAAADMEDKFKRTAYAQMTALIAAKTFYTAGDIAAAKTQLQWAVDHAKDSEYVQIAKLRLVALLVDEKAYDAGLALLAGPAPEAFKGLVADRRGDVLAAQGNTGDARAAYRLALQTLPTGDAAARQLVQFKLDALGG